MNRVLSSESCQDSRCSTSNAETLGKFRYAMLHVAFLLAPFIGGSAGAVELSSADARALRAAQQAVNTRDHGQAVKLLLPLHSKYPNYGDIPRLLTHAYYGLGDFDQARKAALTAINSGRLTSDVLVRLAKIDQQRNDRLALINTVRLLTIIEADSNDWRLIYGDMLATSGAFRESATVYQSLIDGLPDSAMLYLRLGNVLLQDERLNEAVVNLETAYHLGAEDSRLPLAIAGVWQRLNDHRKAVVWMDRGLAIDNANTPLQLQLAQQLFGLKELDRARQQAESLTQSADPHLKSQAHLLLGQIANSREQAEAAAAHWRQAVDCGIDSPKLFKVLGAHYYNSGEFRQAAEFLKRAVDAEDGNDEENLRFLVFSLIQSGNRDGGRQYLRQYIERQGLNDDAKKMIQFLLAARVSNASPVP